jgi:hypothetical protein
MFLRAKKRIKDGKVHRYWSIVESYRVDEAHVLQRQVGSQVMGQDQLAGGG